MGKTEHSGTVENDPQEPNPACVAPGPRATEAKVNVSGVPVVEVPPPIALSVEAVQAMFPVEVVVMTAA